MAEYTQLVSEAMKARENSYCPYSGFAVGAALLATDGTIYRGCNVENSSYGATNCAERTALFAAVADGKRRGDFVAIAIAGGPREGELIPCPPCGICRQALSEFVDAAEFTVLWATGAGVEYEEYTLVDLLPHGFEL